MKKVFLFAVLASLTICFSCNKAEQDDSQPTITSTNQGANPIGSIGDGQLTFRSCPNVTDCECTVTTDASVDLTVCGNLPTGTAGPCFYGSCSQSTDSYIQETWPANAPKTFCVGGSGKICIRNNSMSSVGVRVQFSGGTVMSVTLAAGTYHCFHTNGNCETLDGC